MNGNEHLPSMPDDVVELLAGARGLEAPPSDVASRLRARLVPPTPPPAGRESAPSAAGAGKLASWSKAPWWAVAAALFVGVGVGRFTAPTPDRRQASAELRTEAPEPSSAPEATAPAAPLAVAPPSSEPSAPPASSAPSASPEPSVVARAVDAAVEKSSHSLGTERRLLAIARTALGRSNGDAALTACDEHARRFPRGELAEERDAIAVQALVESRRMDEARARASRFQRDYPKSILLPAVMASIETE